MTFKQAAAYVMPYGKYRGKTLDKIAETDEGLKYLEWLRDDRRIHGGCKQIDTALAAYLDDPTIQRELAQL